MEPFIGCLVNGQLTLASTFFLDLWHLRIVLAILGKGLSEAGFTTVSLYTTELYPTVVRYVIGLTQDSGTKTPVQRLRYKDSGTKTPVQRLRYKDSLINNYKY